MYNSMNSGRARGRTTKTSYPLGLTRCATRRGTLGLTLSIFVAGVVLMMTPDGLGQEPPPASFKTAAVFCTKWDGTDCLPSKPVGMDIARIMGFAPGITDVFPEVAVANSSTDPRSITIYKNTGDWTGDPPSNGLVIHAIYPTYQEGQPFDVAFGDFDNDLDLDLAVSLSIVVKEAIVPIVWVLRNVGGGVFEHGYTIEGLLSTNIQDLEVADFDADGTVDIALAGTATDPSSHAVVELLWNQGGDAFTKQLFESTAVSSAGFSIDSGRVKPSYGSLVPLDIVMSMSSGGKMLVLINDGAGNFTGSTQDAADSFGIAIGHFRADPFAPDLTLSEFSGNRNSVYWGDVSGIFERDFRYPLRGGENPFGVDVGHLNGDAYEDIVVALTEGTTFGDGGIAVFPGRGDGTFSTSMNIEDFIFDVHPGNTPKPCYVQIVDMNYDGFPDVVTSNYDSHTISVLINNFVATPAP